MSLGLRSFGVRRHGYRSYNGIEIVGVMEEGGAFVGNTPGNLVNSKLIPIAIGLEVSFGTRFSFVCAILLCGLNGKFAAYESIT